MSRNIGVWALIGFIVACCWVVIGIAVGPSYNLGHSTVVSITAPASFLGRRVPLSFYWLILLNAAIYAVVGLGTEFLRRQHRQ
jgi:hypothetical protein